MGKTVKEIADFCEKDIEQVKESMEKLENQVKNSDNDEEIEESIK